MSVNQSATWHDSEMETHAKRYFTVRCEVLMSGIMNTYSFTVWYIYANISEEPASYIFIPLHSSILKMEKASSTKIMIQYLFN